MLRSVRRSVRKIDGSTLITARYVPLLERDMLARLIAGETPAQRRRQVL
jgi:hypothetical protein